MEKRRFGRSGHESTVAIFGAAAFFDISHALPSLEISGGRVPNFVGMGVCLA